MSQEIIVHQSSPRPSVQAGVTPRALVPSDIEGVWRVAQMLAASGMVPRDINTAEKVSVSIMHGLEIGLTPMQAVQSIAVVNGRPTIWGDAALALVRASGLMESFSETMTGEDDNMEAICSVSRKGEKSPITGKFSAKDARVAGLWDKAGPWKQYPKRMLQVRARGFCLRDAFPDVLKGLAIKEEMDDVESMRDRAPPPPKDIQESAAPSNVSRVVAADAGGEQIYQGSSSSPAHIEHDGPDFEKLVSDFEEMCKTGKKYDLLEEERDAIIALDQLPREFALRAQNALEGAANRIDEEEAEAERKRVADAEAKAAKAAAAKAKKAAAEADAAPKQQADQAPPPPAEGDDFPGDKPAPVAPPPPADTAPSPAEVDMALAAQRDPAAIVRQLARQKAKNGTKRFNMWFGSLSDEDAKIVEEMTDMDEQIRVAEAADAAAKAAEANGG